METSILVATKEILGLDADDDAFDLDIITHINTALSVLYQMGVLSAASSIESLDTDWDALALDVEVLSMVRSYVFLKTQFLWDPPTTSFLIKARQDQIAELEYRMNMYAETVPVEVVVDNV
jgi:hypothetical protein